MLNKTNENLMDLVSLYRNDMHDIGMKLDESFGMSIDKAGSIESDDALVSFDAGYYHALARVCNDLFEMEKELRTSG
tara:strand:- start:12409 stop:12639 length:231 start_codon:yes stop_codon:yes gene_type:complete